MVCSDGQAQKETQPCSDITDESWRKDVRTQATMGAPAYNVHCFLFLHNGAEIQAFVIKTKVCAPQHRACQSLSVALTSFLRSLGPKVIRCAGRQDFSLNIAARQSTVGHSETELVPHLNA